MRIAIIRAQETRHRYRFVSVPLEQGGHDVHYLERGSVLGLLRSLLATRRNSDRTDAIISVGGGASGLLAFLTTRGASMPFLLRLGGDPLTGLSIGVRTAWRRRQPGAFLKASLNYLVERLLLACVREVIVVNPDLGARLVPYMQRSARTFVIPQFCPGEPISRSHRIDSVAVLLSVTNLNNEIKADGISWLADRLIEHARETRENIIFRIAGGGVYLAKVQKHVSESPIPPSLKIELLGFIENLEPAYTEADIFVYNSEFDATPNVLLEAKRFALPILVNDLEALYYVIKHDCSGFVYADGPSFKRHLGRLLTDEEARRELAAAGLRELQSKFSVEASRSGLEAALTTSIERQSK